MTFIKNKNDIYKKYGIIILNKYRYTIYIRIFIDKIGGT